MGSESALFRQSQGYFQSVVAELTGAGLSLSPRLELRSSDGLLCYYDFNAQVIYLSLPDRDTPQGRLQLLLLRSLLACENGEEVLHLLRLILHWLVVHEVAHHVRHYYGLLSVNVWHEEQIANTLALAMSKPRFSAAESAECHRLLQRGVHNLAGKLEAGSSVTDSYHYLAHSLHVAGGINHQALQQIEQLRRQTGLLCETILRRSMVSALPDIEARIHNRYRIVRRMNAAAKPDIVRYLYYYFGWMHIGLMSTEQYTIQDFARRYLNQEMA